MARLLLIGVLVLGGCDETPSQDPYLFQDGGLPDGAPFHPPDTNGDDSRVQDTGAPDAVENHPAIYPRNRTLSPITPHVADNLRNITSKLQRDGAVFAKVGASATASKAFLHCFAGTKVDLGTAGHLTSTINHFKNDLGDGTTPFDRTSLTAVVGWSAGKAISGSPSPLMQEINAISPRFAVVMYGTNDIQLKNIFGYADNMLDLTDQLIAEGVVPLLTTIMPRDDSASADLQVPRYNAVVRAVAQARQVPLIDYHRELAPLPDHGLGSDKLHPSVYGGGGCVLTAAGLQHGYNIRNLLTLQTFDRVKRVVVDNGKAPDPAGPARRGSGAPGDPVVIDSFPFVALGNTAGWPHSNLNAYGGCNATQDEAGPEVLYRLDLSQPTTIRALVFDRGQTDIDIHLLDGTATTSGCLQRAHQELSTTLQPGTYHFALDTFVKSGQPMAGEFLFVVLEE